MRPVSGRSRSFWVPSGKWPLGDGVAYVQQCITAVVRRATVFLFAAVLGIAIQAGGDSCRCVASDPFSLEPFRQAQTSLCAAMDAAGGALADQVLDTIVADAIPADLMGSVGSLQSGGGHGVVDPLELVRELESWRICPRCGGTLPAPPGTDEALAGMRDVVFTHAEELLRKQPEPAPATRRRLAACCMVCPLLIVPEKSWDAAATASLPAWLQAAPWRTECESFALHAGRPLTAYHLSEPDAAPGNDPVSAYLIRVANRMAEERDYLAGLTCLRTGLRLAIERGDAKQIEELACQLGERMANYGQPAEAAFLLSETLAGKPGPEDPSRIAVTRMTYLYKTEDYATVATQVDQWLREQRYPSHRAQLLYLAWASFRRLGEREKADTLADAFLASYPTEPLAADILYAKAMEALAQADYKQAQALLEKTKHEFPESPLGKRVDELLARLVPLMGGSHRREEATP